MIFIRADANERIGTGHVMRCLSIARAFASIGKEVVFITADHRGDTLISGYLSICLDSIWNEMDSEIEKLEELIKAKKPELLLIDSYFVTEKYLKTASVLTQVAYMDDLNVQSWGVDFLINYNIFADVLDYTCYDGKGTTLLLNPQFAPLREEFKNCQKHKIKDVSDVLVSAGGADPEHITEKIMSGICPEMLDVQFHFVVGVLNPRLDKIKSLAEGEGNAVLHINEKHMSGLMQNCDIAISAAGTTLYELCATGIPTITYTLADNQLVAAEQFDKQGIMISAGDCRDDGEFIGRLAQLLKKLTIDNRQREDLSRKMQGLVDGLGADRIVDELLHLG